MKYRYLPLFSLRLPKGFYYGVNINQEGTLSATYSLIEGFLSFSKGVQLGDTKKLRILGYLNEVNDNK